MKKKWMIAVLALVCIALVACGVLIGIRLRADRSSPDTRSSPEGEMLTAEEMQLQIDALQKEHQNLNQALELSDQERTKLQEELRDVKAALEVNAQEKTAWQDEAEKLTAELANAQSTILSLSASQGEKTGDGAENGQEQTNGVLPQGGIDQNEADALRAEVASLKEALLKAQETAESETGAYETRLAALNAELTEAQEAATAVLAEKDTLNTQMDALTESLTAMEQEKDALDGQITGLQAEAAAARDALAKSKNETKVMENRIIALTKQLSGVKTDAEQEKDSLNAQIAELQAALAEQDEQTRTHQAAVDELEQSATQASQDRELLEGKIDSLQAEISAAQKALENSKNETKIMENRIVALTQQLSDAQADNAEREELREKLASMQATLEETAAALATAKNETKVMEERIIALTKQVNDAKADTQQQQESLTAAVGEKDALTEQLAQIQAALAEQQTQNDDYQTRSAALADSLTAAVEEKDALSVRITALEADISAMDTALKKAQNDKRIMEERVIALTKQLNAAKASNQEENDSLAAQFIELQAALTEQQGQTEACQAEADALAENLAAVQQEKAALETQIATLQANAEAAAAALEKAQNNTRIMEERVIVLTKQIDSLKADAQQEKDSLTAQIEEMRIALENNQMVGSEREALEAQIAALQKEAESVNGALAQSKNNTRIMENMVIALNRKLSDSNAEAQQEKDGLTAKLDELQTALAEQQQLTETYQTKAAALADSLTAAGQEKEALDTQIAALQADIDSVNAALAKSQNNTRIMEDRVISLTKQLNSTKADAQEERDKLNAQLTELRAALAKQEGQTEAYQAEAAALADSLNTATQENETLTGRIASLEENISSLQTALAKSQNETGIMEDRVIVLNRQLNNTKADAQQERENLNGQISGLQAELEASGLENDGLRQEIAALQADAETLRGDLNQSRNNTQVMEARVISLNKEINKTKEDAQQEQTRLNGRIDDLEATLKATEDSLTAERKENESLTAQLTSTNATLADTQAELASTSATLADTKAELTSTSATLADTKAELTSTSATLADTQAELTSTSATLADTEDRNTMLVGQLENLVVSMQTESSFQLVDTNADEGDTLTTLLNQYVGLEIQADESIRRQGLLPKKEAEEDGGDAVITVNGESVSRAKVERAVETALLIRKHVLEAHPEWEGQPSLSLDRTVVARQITTQMAENLALWQKAQSLGLDAMTDAERQSIIDEAIELQATTGYSAEEMLPSLLVAHTMEKLREWAAQGVTVTNEEFTKELNSRKYATQALYEKDPDAFAQLIESGEGFYHYPTAYRRVKQIFIAADTVAYEQLKTDLRRTKTYCDDLDYELRLCKTGDEREALKKKREAATEKLAALQAQWDATAAQSEQAIAQAQQAITDIYARLKAGESFDTLIAEYSDSTDMPEGGYVIGEGRKQPFRDFVVRGLCLQQEGNVTQPIMTDDGYYILYYAEDLSKDWASLRSNDAALLAEMLAERRQLAADDAFAQWIAEADIKIQPTLLGF